MCVYIYIIYITVVQCVNIYITSKREKLEERETLFRSHMFFENDGAAV